MKLTKFFKEGDQQKYKFSRGEFEFNLYSN